MALWRLLIPLIIFLQFYNYFSSCFLHTDLGKEEETYGKDGIAFGLCATHVLNFQEDSLLPE